MCCDNTKTKVYVVYRGSDHTVLLTTLNRDEAVGRAVREKAYVKEHVLSMYGGGVNDIIYNPGWKDTGSESWFYEDTQPQPTTVVRALPSTRIIDATFENVTERVRR